MGSSTALAYALWLVGGFSGLHHFYLGRLCHGFVWLSTGGGFGVGWLWDLFELPAYCHEAAERPKRLLDNAASRRRNASCTTYRFVGMLLTGGWYGTLATLAMPSYFWGSTIYDKPLLAITQSSVIAMACSFGVYLVGNIGLQQRPLLQMWLGAWPTALVTVGVFGAYDKGLLATCIVAILLSNRFAQTRIRRPPYRLAHLCLWLTCYLGFYSSIAYNHVLTQKIYVDDHETTIGRMVWAALTNLDSLKGDTHFTFYGRADSERSSEESWERYWRNFMDDAFQHGGSLRDAALNTHAYYMLKVDRHASKQTIRAKCRQLMKEHHPDRATDGVASATKFVQYREACERLGATSRPRDKTPDDEYKQEL